MPGRGRGAAGGSWQSWDGAEPGAALQVQGAPFPAGIGVSRAVLTQTGLMFLGGIITGHMLNFLSTLCECLCTQISDLHICMGVCSGGASPAHVYLHKFI